MAQHQNPKNPQHKPWEKQTPQHKPGQGRTPEHNPRHPGGTERDWERKNPQK